MRRKGLFWPAFLCLALLPLCLACYVFVSYNDRLDTFERIEEKNDILLDLFLTVEGKETQQDIRLFHSEADGGYYLFLPSFAQPKKGLRLSIRDGAALQIGEERCEDGGLWKGAQDGVSYQVRAEGRDGETLAEGRLTVLQSAQLPAMFIRTSSGSMRQIHEDQEYREEGRLSLVTEKGKTDYEGDLSWIKGRGNVTWIYRSKKPYSLKLKYEYGLLGMNQSRSWALLANAFDGSGLRNKVMYEMAREAGLQNTPDSEFVDLYLNGEYAGLYQLAEKVEVGENRVDITDLEKQTAAANEKPLEEYPAFYEEKEGGRIEKGVRLPQNPPDLTGGYLVEMDFIERFAEEASGFVTRDGQAFTLASPEYASEEQVSYISGLFQEIETAILDSQDGTNPETGRNIRELIDLPSWVKVHLVEELSGNQDAYLSSQYYYKDRDSRDGRVYAGPVWDFDVSSGNVECVNYKNPASLSASMVEVREEGVKEHWIPTLYERSYFKEALTQEYEQTFLPVLEKLLNEKIDAFAEQIRPAEKLDEARWAAERGDWFWEKQDSFDGQVAYLKDFLSKKRDFLTSLWLEEETYYVVRFRADELTYHDAVFYCRPGETLKLPQVSWQGAAFLGWYDVRTGERAEGAFRVEGDRELKALWQELDGSVSLNSVVYDPPVG